MYSGQKGVERLKNDCPHVHIVHTLGPRKKATQKRKAGKKKN
jgi:hypothetical protein